MKMLITIHLVLNEFSIGILFAEIFTEWKFKCFEAKKKSESEHILLLYYQYLQKMALNVQVYHACKVQQYPLCGDNYIDTA